MNEQKVEKINDSITENTDISCCTEKMDNSENPSINRIVQSTEQIIRSQAMKIFQQTNEIKQLKRQNQIIQAKYETLMRIFQEREKNETENKLSGLADELMEKIRVLQNQLINSKMEIAMVKAENLEIKFSGMKHQRLSIFQSIETIRFPDVEKLKSSLLQQSKLQRTDDNFNIVQWKKCIESYLVGFPRVKKFKQKSSELIRKGIPHSLRQNLWPFLFVNKIGITDALFPELLSRKEKDQNYTKRVLSQINKDLLRSFNGKTKFDSKVGLSNQVTEILQVFHIYRPDVSYVQGMTYPVIVLNLIVGKYKAFSIFSNLILGNQFFRRLYTFDSTYLTCYCRAFQILLEEKQPKVFKILIEKSIKSELYLVQWFYTFYSRGFSYEFTLKIWDYLAYQEELLFYKLGLAIFQLLQGTLLHCKQEPILVLRQFSKYFTEQKFEQTLLNQRLSLQKLEKIFDRLLRNQIKNQQN